MHIKAKPKRQDGGPAFPASIFVEQTADEQSWIETKGGMTLRDYFAAVALPALIAGEYGPDGAAVKAYVFADAMLTEREK